VRRYFSRGNDAAEELLDDSRELRGESPSSVAALGFFAMARRTTESTNFGNPDFALARRDGILVLDFWTTPRWSRSESFLPGEQLVEATRRASTCRWEMSSLPAICSGDNVVGRNHRRGLDDLLLPGSRAKSEIFTSVAFGEHEVRRLMSLWTNAFPGGYSTPPALNAICKTSATGRAYPQRRAWKDRPP